MAPFLDARLPVLFGQPYDAGPADALLLEGEGEAAQGQAWFVASPGSSHPADCACCQPRNEAGMALARLILARGRGDGLFFNRVIVVATTQAGRMAVMAALEADPIVSCVCRLVPPACPSGDITSSKEVGGAVPAPPNPPSVI